MAPQDGGRRPSTLAEYRPLIMEPPSSFAGWRFHTIVPPYEIARELRGGWGSVS